MNTKENRKKWLEKFEGTLEIGGKNNKTFKNYRCHINRFLNYFNYQNIKKNENKSRP